MVSQNENPATSIGFQLRELRVTSYLINEEQLTPENEFTFGIQIDHSFDLNGDVRVVRVKLTVGYMPKQVLVELHLECYYQLAGYQEWLSFQLAADQAAGALPIGLATALNSIAISTTRGVLYERLRGTSLQGIVLPVVDPSAFQESN